jgi:light-regulated signal transduction histidine kinase (bacteriophytochrome)
VPRPEEAKASSELSRSLTDPRFLAALCHDLRGPLGAIGTWIHVLGSGRADDATQQQALAAMQRDVQAQGRLIEQLADLSSILAGTLRLTVAAVDLRLLLAEMGADLRGEVEAPKVLGDLTRLRQLFALLLPGAGGSTRPALTARAEEPGALWLRGLSPAGALGLVSLTLARALAEIQGGQLATSGTAEGTVFAIQLLAPAT